jgi:hypothetical protein
MPDGRRVQRAEVVDRARPEELLRVVRIAAHRLAAGDQRVAGGELGSAREEGCASQRGAGAERVRAGVVQLGRVLGAAAVTAGDQHIAARNRHLDVPVAGKHQRRATRERAGLLVIELARAELAAARLPAADDQHGAGVGEGGGRTAARIEHRSGRAQRVRRGVVEHGACGRDAARVRTAGDQHLAIQERRRRPVHPNLADVPADRAPAIRGLRDDRNAAEERDHRGEQSEAAGESSGQGTRVHTLTVGASRARWSDSSMGSPVRVSDGLRSFERADAISVRVG